MRVGGRVWGIGVGRGMIVRGSGFVRGKCVVWDDWVGRGGGKVRVFFSW